MFSNIGFVLRLSLASFLGRVPAWCLRVLFPLFYAEKGIKSFISAVNHDGVTESVASSTRSSKLVVEMLDVTDKTTVKAVIHMNRSEI